MAAKVGEIYYDVTLDTRKMVEGQRAASAQAAKAASSLQSIGGAADKAGASLDGLRGRLTAVASAVSALAAAMFLVSQSDAYTKMNAQLELATGSSSKLASAQRSVIATAQEAQTDLSAISILYARITNATKELGASQQRVGDITRAVALSMKISGASAEESASAMLQLSQSFASGVMRGEEFNSVSEAAPRLMKALADGLNVPIGQLRSMAAEGKLTSDVLATVLPKALSQLEEEAKHVQTIGGSFQELRNEVMLFVGQQMQASGAAKMTATAIAGLAGQVKDLDQNLDSFLTAAEVGAQAFAAVVAGRFAQSLQAGVVGLIQQAEASRQAAAAELMRLKALQTTAYEVAAKAAAERAGALATAEAAAASVAAARAELSLASVEAERTAAAAALAAGTLSQAATTEQAALASARLAAAKVADTDASVALAAAERALTLARTQEAASAATATASTTALATAQRAQAASAGVAAGATRLFSGVVAALGGPVGIAVIALGALAWNWDKIGTSAKSAGEISEEAAQKIAKASSRSAEAPMRQLMKARDDAEANIARLDEQIKRAEASEKRPAYSRMDERFDRAPKIDTSRLREQREAYRGALLDTQKAIEDFKKQQVTDLFPDQEGPLKKPPPTKEFQAKAQEAQAYYQGLVAANLRAGAQIDAEEKKALAENQKRMVEDAANAGIYAKAKLEIQKKFARERAMLEEQTTEQVAEYNIELTTDEVARIGLIREEAVRRADALAQLGVKTHAQAEQDKVIASLQASRQLAALQERLDQTTAETRISATIDELTKIDLARQESFRRADAAARAGAITYAQAEAEKARAAVDAQNAIRQQVLSINPLAQLEQEYQQKLAIVQYYEEQMAKAGVDGTQFVEQKRTELATQYQQQRLALAEAEFTAQGDGNKFVMDTLNSLSSTATSTITGLISGTTSAADAMRALGGVILNEAVKALVQIGVQYVKNALIGQAAEKAQMAAKAANAALYTTAITAQVTGTTALAAQNAFMATAAIPVVGPGLAPAAAAAAGAAAAALGAPAIASAPIAGARQYGGGVDAGSLYRVNETGQPEMYTASNGKQYMLPTKDGNVTPADQVGGGSGGWNIIINNAPAGTVANVDQQSRTIEIAVAQAKSQIAAEFSSNTGETWNALRGSSNVQGRI
ncbi:tape measure protein [Roseateles sp. SL47]|uniref:tape measure protein n=1 Tax=Roseateles sp. SL47 TaxID=2995138 RepID=UPI002270CDD9|nr:tape measure protein [Roseateles sp. SL47]WAC75368.1 tape measure protein [Roseateles sp. SL47]